MKGRIPVCNLLDKSFQTRATAAWVDPSRFHAGGILTEIIYKLSINWTNHKLQKYSLRQCYVFIFNKTFSLSYHFLKNQIDGDINVTLKNSSNNMTQSQNSNMTKLLNYFHYFTWKVQVGLAWLLSIQLPINKNFPADTLGLINWLVLLIVLFFLIMSECDGRMSIT